MLTGFEWQIYLTSERGRVNLMYEYRNEIQLQWQTQTMSKKTQPFEFWSVSMMPLENGFNIYLTGGFSRAIKKKNNYDIPRQNIKSLIHQFDSFIKTFFRLTMIFVIIIFFGLIMMIPFNWSWSSVLNLSWSVPGIEC